MSPSFLLPRVPRDRRPILYFFLVVDTLFFPFFLAASTPFSLLPHRAASGGSIVLAEGDHTRDQISILQFYTSIQG